MVTKAGIGGEGPAGERGVAIKDKSHGNLCGDEDALRPVSTACDSALCSQGITPSRREKGMKDPLSYDLQL